MTPPEVREERKRKLRTLTQSEYAELLSEMERIMRPGFCDAGDALNNAIIIALSKYTGEGSLKGFIKRTAWLDALDQYGRTRKREFLFTELEDEEIGEHGDWLDAINRFAHYDDPRYVEGVDEKFVYRIEQILYQSRDYTKRYATRQAAADAKRILQTYRVNSNLGKGVGIDEYEEGLMNTSHGARKPRRDRRLHNNTVARNNINRRLCDELSIKPSNLHAANQGLRKATLQAVHEGWLP